MSPSLWGALAGFALGCFVTLVGVAVAFLRWLCWPEPVVVPPPHEHRYLLVYHWFWEHPTATSMTWTCADATCPYWEYLGLAIDAPDATNRRTAA